MKSDLERYVLANYSRKEILDFASRDYPEYAWSLPTLSRRLNFSASSIFVMKPASKMSRKLYERKWKVQGSTLDIEPCRENFGNNIIWLFLVIWSMM